MTETFYSDLHRQVFYKCLTEPADLRVPFDAAFPVLIWSSTPDYPVEKQAALFRLLFAHGCRYVVAAGEQCELWHDVADEQFLAQYSSEGERSDNFVMTSWHTDESESDVVFFFILSTSFDEHAFSRFLILQIGEDEGVRKRIADAVQRWAPDTTA